MQTVKEFIELNPLAPFYAERGTVHNYRATRGPVSPHKKPSIAVQWDSAADLVEYVNGLSEETILADRSHVANNKVSEQRRTDSDQWRFGELLNFEATAHALTNGIATTRQREYFDDFKNEILRKYPNLADIEAQAYVTRRRKVFAESGDELDIDRYLNGEVEQWTKKGFSKIIKRTARIHLAMPTSSANSPDNFSKAVAFVAALSDIVESAGISTEILISFSVSDAAPTESYFSGIVKAKNVEEPLDINRLLSLGHVGLYRNFIFVANSNVTATTDVRRTSGSKGHCISRAIEVEYIKPVVDADVFVYAGDVFINQFFEGTDFQIIIKDILTAIGQG